MRSVVETSKILNWKFIMSDEISKILVVCCSRPFGFFFSMSAVNRIVSYLEHCLLLLKLEVQHFFSIFPPLSTKRWEVMDFHMGYLNKFIIVYCGFGWALTIFTSIVVWFYKKIYSFISVLTPLRCKRVSLSFHFCASPL